MATRNIPNLPQSVREELLLFAQKAQTAMRAQGLALHRDYCDESQAGVTGSALEIITEGSPADLAAVIVRANELKRLMNLHLASTAKHIAADATNTISSANATDQTSVNTLLNEIKGDLNAHHDSATYHDVGPTAGAVGAAPADTAVANASDLATSQALTASLCAMWNRHVRSGLPDLALGAS